MNVLYNVYVQSNWVRQSFDKNNDVLKYMMFHYRYKTEDFPSQ